MFNDLSLPDISQMGHELSKKKEKKKMACPRSMTQKKYGRINVHEKKEKKIK